MPLAARLYSPMHRPVPYGISRGLSAHFLEGRDAQAYASWARSLTQPAEGESSEALRACALGIQPTPGWRFKVG